MPENGIKSWAEDDRPREKMLKSGPASLSDAELIAILIRTGNSTATALDLAREILLSGQNDLQQLAMNGIPSLSNIKGIGAVKAITLHAALELGRRCRLAEVRQKAKINTSRDAFSFLEPLLRDLPHEEFWILLLNRANMVIDTRMISRGGVSGTVVDPKLIFHEALQQKASAIILGHNHPSANPNPSESDLKLTKKIKEAGHFLEISVLDHIIVAGNTFYSFADEGTL